jgi:hypothetical protein
MRRDLLQAVERLGGEFSGLKKSTCELRDPVLAVPVTALTARLRLGEFPQKPFPNPRISNPPPHPNKAS